MRQIITIFNKVNKGTENIYDWKKKAWRVIFCCNSFVVIFLIGVFLSIFFSCDLAWMRLLLYCLYSIALNLSIFLSRLFVYLSHAVLYPSDLHCNLNLHCNQSIIFSKWKLGYESYKMSYDFDEKYTHLLEQSFQNHMLSCIVLSKHVT